jgi:hypothetical protein
MLAGGLFTGGHAFRAGWILGYDGLEEAFQGGWIRYRLPATFGDYILWILVLCEDGFHEPAGHARSQAPRGAHA